MIGFITPPISWCVVGVLAQYGCLCIIQVDAAYWWWLTKFPFPYKKCNKLLLLDIVIHFSGESKKLGTGYLEKRHMLSLFKCVL